LQLVGLGSGAPVEPLWTLVAQFDSDARGAAGSFAFRRHPWLV